MKNKHILYHILISIEIISILYVIYCFIRLCNLGIEKIIFITGILLFFQICEFLMLLFFFYVNLNKNKLIETISNIVIYSRIFLLGISFGEKFSERSKESILLLILKVLFTLYVIICCRIRMKEVKQNNHNS